MAGYYEERWSRSAIWCQRIALFLAPYFVILIGLYRFYKIDTFQMFALLAIGLFLAMLGMVFAIVALSELWNKGYRGGNMVIRGMIIILLILLPFGYQAYLALLHPLANDVSTDTFNPPLYINAIEYRAKRIQFGINPVQEYSEEYSDLIVEAYPKVRSRRYPAGSERVLEAVRAIVKDNGWPVTGEIVPTVEPETSDEELADNTTSEEIVEEGLQVPQDISVEALVKTFIFGFENDVVIRISSEDQNTLVDMRASSRWGQHDFGYNAKLIKAFLEQLDTALLGIAGEG